MPNDFNVGNAVKQLIWTGVYDNTPFSHARLSRSQETATEPAPPRSSSFPQEHYFPTARITVPAPTPSCFAIWRMLAPLRRISITLSRLKILFGRPMGRFFLDPAPPRSSSFPQEHYFPTARITVPAPTPSCFAIWRNSLV